MLKSELVDYIVDSITDDEWRDLDEGTLPITITRVNRRLLLSLWDEYGDFEGEVDDAAVAELEDVAEEFLIREWPQEPEAHRFVVLTCLARAFLYGRPLHPPELVRYHRKITDGKIRYFCPERDPENERLCRYCCAEPMDEIAATWQAQIDAAARDEGETTARILREAFHAGIMNAGIVKKEDLVFYEDVRSHCSRECRFYGLTWACPPHVGPLDECRERVSRYDKMLLLSTPFVLADMSDFKEIDYTASDFQRIMRDMCRRIKPIVDDFFLLRNETCFLCKKCTCPDAPCRYPGDVWPPLESFGFRVAELAELAGIPSMNGPSTTTYFGAVFYNE